MLTTTFDADIYKATTTEQWQNAAKAWSEWNPALRHWLGSATEIMIDLAEIREGSSVLDVAAGAGDQSMQAADRVGPDGYILATDISSNILDHANANAQAKGYGQIDVHVMDGENLTLEADQFDAVISRVGMIYFPDQVKALQGILRVLRPGGRFSTMVYSTPEANGFFSVPVRIIREAAQLPPPVKGQPGPFSLGQPGALASLMQQAGFKDVSERTVSAPLHMESAEECARFQRESFGALHEMLKGLAQDRQEQAWADVETALTVYETGEGFSGPCELIIVSGEK